MTSNSRFGVTSEDLRRYDWQERLARHPRKECRSYFQVFIPAADECATVGDDPGVQGLFVPQYRCIISPGLRKEGKSVPTGSPRGRWNAFLDGRRFG